MDTKAHYTLVGLVVVFLGIMMVTVGLWLSVGLDRPVYNTFVVNMDQSVTGLTETAPVKYNGVTVGSVQDLALNADNPQEVIVILKIQSGTPVTTSTIATLTPQGITGIAYIDLSATTPNAPWIKIHNTPPYPVIASGPSILVQLSTLLKETSSSFTGVSSSVQRVLDAQNEKNIKAILINLNTITKNMADNTAAFNKIVLDTRVFMDNAAKSSGELTHHFNAIAANLEQLTAELQANPAILVRGRTPAQPGPGEK